MDSPARVRARALAAVALVAPVPTLGVVLAMVATPGPAGRAAFLVGKLWLLLLPAAWLLFVERGRLSWSPPRRGGLGAGLLLGLATAVAIAAAAWLALPRLDPGPLRSVLVDMGLASPARLAAAAAAWTLLNSLMEEYLWRWFVLTRCERLMPGGAAAVVSALLFTVHHGVAMSRYLAPGLVALACLGVLAGGWSWGWCYLRFRSIWPGWIAHVLADVAVFAAGWYLAFG